MADPGLSVSDLMVPLQEAMESCGSRDAWKIVNMPADVSWKTAPHATWLAAISPLFQKYARFVPNSIIPRQKHKIALTRLNAAGKINYTKRPEEDFADALDEQGSQAKSRCQGARLQESGQGADPGRGGGALLASCGDAGSASRAAGKGNGAGCSQGADACAHKCSLARAQAVRTGLQRPPRSVQARPFTAGFQHRQRPSCSSPPQKLKRKTADNLKQRQEQVGFLSTLMALHDLPEGDAELLQNMKKQKPIHTNGKGQLQILRAAKKQQIQEQATSQASGAPPRQGVLKRPAAKKAKPGPKPTPKQALPKDTEVQHGASAPDSSTRVEDKAYKTSGKHRAHPDAYGTLRGKLAGLRPKPKSW